MSLYWSSRSLHLKDSPNQISHKSTQGRPYQIVLNLRKVQPNPQILCSSVYQNNLSQHYQGTNTHDWGYEGGHTYKDKTKSNPLKYSSFLLVGIFFGEITFWGKSFVGENFSQRKFCHLLVRYDTINNHTPVFHLNNLGKLNQYSLKYLGASEDTNGNRNVTRLKEHSLRDFCAFGTNKL